MDFGKRKLILGVGDLFHGDDGLGIHALHALRAAFPRPASFDWQECKRPEANLLPLVEASSHLLVLSVLPAGMRPGTLVSIEGAQAALQSPTCPTCYPNCVQPALELARWRGNLPTHFLWLGIEPAERNLSLRLSQEVQAALPGLVQRATHVLRGWAEATIQLRPAHTGAEALRLTR